MSATIIDFPHRPRRYHLRRLDGSAFAISPVLTDPEAARWIEQTIGAELGVTSAAIGIADEYITIAGIPSLQVS